MAAAAGCLDADGVCRLSPATGHKRLAKNYLFVAGQHADFIQPDFHYQPVIVLDFRKQASVVSRLIAGRGLRSSADIRRASADAGSNAAV